jgi:hypothetical protein
MRPGSSGGGVDQQEEREDGIMRMMEVIDKAEFEPWMIGILEPLIAKLVAKVEIARIEPVLCSIEEATVITGRSKRFIIDAIARGLIDAKKSDKRVLPVCCCRPGEYPDANWMWHGRDRDVDRHGDENVTPRVTKSVTHDDGSDE